LTGKWGPVLPLAVIANSRAGQRPQERIGYRPRLEHLPNRFGTDEPRPNPRSVAAYSVELGIDDETIVIELPERCHPTKDHRAFLEAAVARSGTPYIVVRNSASRTRWRSALASSEKRPVISWR
jgi:hypothetical protein